MSEGFQTKVFYDALAEIQGYFAYQQPPNDTCAQAALQDILRQRWQLTLPEEGTGNPRYEPAPSSWYVKCNFTGIAEDGRYATVIEFRPGGGVGMTVYLDASVKHLPRTTD